MVSTSLLSSRLPFFTNIFSKTRLMYSLLSLFVLVCLLQVIAKKKDQNLTDFMVLSKNEIEYRKKFNLMEDPATIDKASDKECSLDYANEHKLAQDHPCVIKLIRQMYLRAPPPPDTPYNLTDVTPDFTSRERNGNDTEALLLKNKKNGFFVECGAFDGFLLSNSLHLELNHSWTGLLIEASPTNYQRLLARKRKAWTSNMCLSLMPYPTKISFTTTDDPVVAKHAVFRIIETDKEGRNIYDHTSDKPFGVTGMKTIKIQCFPFYSLLLATQQTTVDYFSLDIEGHEKRVIETIPFEKVDIKMMRIETANIPSEDNGKTGSDALRNYLEAEAGYLSFKILKYDEIYIKNYIK